jgi:hypothetical protein
VPSTLLSAAFACVVLIRFEPLLSRLPNSFPSPDFVLMVSVIGLV